MLGASNIRQILRDTLAILVWHAVFSSLWNTFKALIDMPAWITGFFLQVMQPQVTIFIFLASVLLVCLVNMLHLSEECWLLTGQVQQDLLYSVAISPSSRLPRFSICCPRSGEYSKCEGVNVWGRACASLFTHVLHVDVLPRTRAQRLLGCCLDCCLVMEIETLFLFIPPPAVTVVSGARSLNSGLWDTWRTVKSTNPPNYAECYSPEHTLDSYYGKQKLRGTFKKCATFIWLSYLYICVCSEIRAATNMILS